MGEIYLGICILIRTGGTQALRCLSITYNHKSTCILVYIDCSIN